MASVLSLQKLFQERAINRRFKIPVRYVAFLWQYLLPLSFKISKLGMLLSSDDSNCIARDKKLLVTTLILLVKYWTKELWTESYQKLLFFDYRDFHWVPSLHTSTKVQPWQIGEPPELSERSKAVRDKQATITHIFEGGPTSILKNRPFKQSNHWSDPILQQKRTWNNTCSPSFPCSQGKK